MPLGRGLAQDPSRFENARMVRLAMQYVMNERIAGDYVEFGVYKGATFVEAWGAAEEMGLDEMRFVACDSFQGLPTDGGPFRAGQFASPRAEFDATLRANRVPPGRVRVIEGFFTPEMPLPDQVAVAWIDCDLYESAVPVLDALTDRLVDGAVLAFDDWFTHRGRPDQGEQKACAEWLERNPAIGLIPWRDFHWAGKAFLVSTARPTPHD